MISTKGWVDPARIPATGSPAPSMCHAILSRREARSDCSHLHTLQVLYDSHGTSQAGRCGETKAGSKYVAEFHSGHGDGGIPSSCISFKSFRDYMASRTLRHRRKLLLGSGGRYKPADVAKSKRDQRMWRNSFGAAVKVASLHDYFLYAFSCYISFPTLSNIARSAP
jgi:hypothetical protein